MYTNITLNTLPLRKSNGLPISIVHLETQFFITIIRMDIIAKYMLTRENSFFRFTSNTFIFDRGKDATPPLVFDRGKSAAIIFHLSVLPVTLNCNLSQQTVNQLEINFGHNNYPEILVLLLARFLTSSSVNKNNERNSKTGKENLLPDTTIIGTIDNCNLTSRHLIWPWFGTKFFVYIPNRLKLCKSINLYYLSEKSRIMSHFSIALSDKFSVGVSWLMVNVCNKIIHCTGIVGIIDNGYLTSIYTILLLPWFGTIFYVYIPSCLRFYNLIKLYYLSEQSRIMSQCSIEPPDKFSVGVFWLINISPLRICKLNSIISNNEQTSELLLPALFFQTLNETAIGKFPNIQLCVNLSNPILRTERISNNNHESSTVMEGDSQSGGFTQKPYMQYEPEDQ